MTDQDPTTETSLPRTPQPPFRPHYNALATLVAIVTSAAALFIAWDQAQVMRAQQHGIVWPVLVINKQWIQSENEVRLRFITENSGVGPALVSSVDFLVDGEDIETTGVIVDTLLASTGPFNEVSTGELRGRAIAPGKNFEVVSFSWQSLEESQIEALSTQWDKIGLKVCYCSVFDRCWVTKTTDSDLPSPIDQCTGNGRTDTSS